MDHDTTGTLTRRRLLRSGAGAVAAGAAVSAGAGTAAAQQDAYGGYLADTPNYDGTTVDATGREELIIDVGAGTGFQFSPAAVVVDPGTTIRWNWTGEGGAHNVYHDDQSDLVDEQVFYSGDPAIEPGVNYEFTFEEEHAGFHPYVCIPHRAQEMKGVIVVGEDALETDTVPLGGGGEGDDTTTAILAGSAVFGATALLGIAAYRDLFDE